MKARTTGLLRWIVGNHFVGTQVIAAIVIFNSVNCASAYTSAERLIKDCTVTPTKPKEAFDERKCFGYIAGVLDAYAVVSGLYRNVRIYCAPAQGLSFDTAVSTLVWWVRAHPDKAEVPARTGLLLALKERYPCQ